MPDEMLSQLQRAEKVVGAKQVKRALLGGQVKKVFLAQNADPRVTQPIEAIAQEMDVPIEFVQTMQQLGVACKIPVGAAVAAQI